MNKPVSDCCNAPMKVGGEGETHYYICTKCKEACDAKEMRKDRINWNSPLMRYLNSMVGLETTTIDGQTWISNHSYVEKLRKLPEIFEQELTTREPVFTKEELGKLSLYWSVYENEQPVDDEDKKLLEKIHDLIIRSDLTLDKDKQ